MGRDRDGHHRLGKKGQIEPFLLTSAGSIDCVVCVDWNHKGIPFWNAQGDRGGPGEESTLVVIELFRLFWRSEATKRQVVCGRITHQLLQVMTLPD